MCCKVTRRVYTKKRPDWMILLLLSLSPEIYEKTPSIDAARKKLSAICSKVKETRVVENRPNRHLRDSSDVVEIVNPKGKPFIRFSIIQA